MSYDSYLTDAANHASDLQYCLARLADKAYHNKNESDFRMYNELMKEATHIERILNRFIDFEGTEPNPAVIARPLKTAKKLKWWAIGLYDGNRVLIKRVVTQYRTKTEAKLYARSSLQMHSMGKAVENALVDGPFATMNEAQTAPLLFPEEV
jgi:hypothetical protein